MTAVTHARGWLHNATLTLILALSGMAIAVTSLVVALQDSNARTSDAQRQTAFLRGTFCGLVQPVADASKAPTQTPRTAFGASIANGAVNAAAQLQCPPSQ